MAVHPCASQEHKKTINDLPDSVLGFILAFLSTKEAFRTCILSRRWEFLWTTVAVLDFDDADGKENDQKLNFIRFVDNVLGLNDVQSIDRFCLRLKQLYSPLLMQRWIINAVARKICVLNICIRREAKIPVPSSLFSMETLEALELIGGLVIHVSSSVLLPKLVTLNLQWVRYATDECILHLVSGCRILDSLTIHRNQLDNLRIITISSSSLRCLCLISCRAYPPIDLSPEDQFRLEINAPSLEYLLVQDKLSIGFSFANMHSLINVRADIFRQNTEHLGSAVRVVEAFSDVVYLDLSSDLMTKLAESPDILSVKFHRLTKLDVTPRCPDWSAVLDLLECSDNLKVLCYRKYCDHAPGINHNTLWRKPDRVPRCLLSIEEISMHALNGTEDELKMMKFLLKHSIELKRIKLHTAEQVSVEDEFEMVKKISNFTRQSQDCQLSFRDIIVYL